MNTLSLPDLVEQLRRYQLLSDERWAVASGELAGHFPDPKGLARELLQRGWLTPFQANQLLQGRGSELVLGSYVLLERLGEGGMGTVYKARHRHLDRLVALKCIRPERVGKTPNVLARFRREAKTTARLAHPNIVVIHDADEDHGQLYYVMEHVEGVTLARLVEQRGRLSEAEACEYIRQAALGLQHAHDHGLVHRDVKPANLILTRAGVVKVLDLGLARSDPGLSDGTTEGLTQSGAVMGTPDYIAPEQCLDAHAVDARADIYSLGCTLYYLLAGHPPFPGGSPVQKLAWHLHSEPPALESVCPGVSPALAAIVRKMLARKPAERLQTAAETAAQLARFTTFAPTLAPTLAGEATVVEPPLLPATLPTRPPTAPAAGVKRRAIVLLGAAVLLLGLCWIGQRWLWPGQEKDAKGQPSAGQTGTNPGVPPNIKWGGGINIVLGNAGKPPPWPEELPRLPGLTQVIRNGPQFTAQYLHGATILNVIGLLTEDDVRVEKVVLLQFTGGQKEYSKLDEVPSPHREVVQTLRELGRRRLFGTWKPQ